jgi:hypothetical protein
MRHNIKVIPCKNPAAMQGRKQKSFINRAQIQGMSRM